MGCTAYLGRVILLKHGDPEGCAVGSHTLVDALQQWVWLLGLLLFRQKGREVKTQGGRQPARMNGGT